MELAADADGDRVAVTRPPAAVPVVEEEDKSDVESRPATLVWARGVAAHSPSMVLRNGGVGDGGRGGAAVCVLLHVDCVGF